MSKKRVGRLIVDLICDWMLTILAADILIGFYTGNWHDTYLWLLAFELIALWIISIAGLFRFYIHVKEAKDDTTSKAS